MESLGWIGKRIELQLVILHYNAQYMDWKEKGLRLGTPASQAEKRTLAERHFIRYLTHMIGDRLT